MPAFIKSLANHNLQISTPEDLLDVQAITGKYDLYIHLNSHEEEVEAAELMQMAGANVILNSAFNSLAEFAAMSGVVNAHVAGINAIPFFLELPIKEMSLLREHDLTHWEAIIEKLGWQARFTSDYPGMITPRVICMIINEAYYTMQEGTATRADIDLSMKLGTNYPYGPFQWAAMLGLPNIVLLLERLQAYFGDERYKVNPLLKREALLSEVELG